MDNIKFRRLGTMLDCSRNAVMKPEMVEKWIDVTSDLGYNCLLMYLEDTYEIEGQPYFGHLRGRYTQQELRRMDDYAAAKGMELIPCIQTLAHVNALMHWPVYKDMRDADDILLAGDDRVYELVDQMFASLTGALRTRIINIGMDEAIMLGRGKYQTLHGYEDKFDILLKHLNRVSEIARKYDLQLLMWGDMFFRLASGGGYYDEGVSISDHIKSMIPDNVNLIYWDYYAVEQKHYDHRAQNHIAIKKDIWFAGGLWCWSGFTPHNDFANVTMAMATKSAMENGVQDVFMTMWGDDGGECSCFGMLPALYSVSQYARGNWDTDSIKKGFEEKFGIPFDEYMLLDLLGTANEKEKMIVTPDKYMLYCDCLMGQFDNKVRPGDAEAYGRCAQKLSKWTDHPRFGYLFRSQQALSRVLAVKFDLGVRTRKAYLEGDRQGLEALLEDYDCLHKRIEEFYSAFRYLWMQENKPFGFEIQDHRLGGLMQRVRHCRQTIQDYLDGRLERIEELEQPVLDVQCLGEKGDGKPIQFNSWGMSISACVK